jgi:hypothetical protein
MKKLVVVVAIFALVAVAVVGACEVLQKTTTFAEPLPSHQFDSAFVKKCAEGLEAELGITNYVAGGNPEKFQFFSFVHEGKTWILADRHLPEETAQELWSFVDKKVPGDDILVVETYWLGYQKAWLETSDGEADYYRVSILAGQESPAIELIKKASAF